MARQALDLLPPLALGLVLALIVTNKVGSPQFVGWLAAPFVLWMLRGASPMRGPGVPLLAIAVLTQAVYPWLYMRLVAADPIVAALLTARNAAYIALLVWTIRAIWRLGTADSGIPGRRFDVAADVLPEVRDPQDATPVPGVTTRES